MQPTLSHAPIFSNASPAARATANLVAFRGLLRSLGRVKQWYCVRSKPRQERVAAERLSGELEVECFLPMATRLRRGARAGQRYREPLFPGYLFARVDLDTELRKVGYAQGVLGFVRSGDRYPTLAESVIEGLRALCADLEEALTANAAVRPGDGVELIGRLFGGTTGTVKELMPAKNRVRVLVEFLNRAVELEVDVCAVTRVEPGRRGD